MANLRLHKERVLVFGANGLLGQKLVQVLREDFEVCGAGRKAEPAVAGLVYSACDLTRPNDVRRLLQEQEPHYVVNAAAYTNVDGCEDDKETCWQVNAHGPGYLAKSAARVGAFLVHVSTDYVFDGREEIYTETAKPHPLSYYGRAKLAGENAVIASGVTWAIVRTMILYGAGVGLRPNFATWLLDRLGQGEPVRIVDDQYGHPTLVDDLAEAIRRILAGKHPGTFHVCGADYVSRYDFARRLAEVFGFDSRLITPIKTADLKQRARRPLRSHFSLEKIRRELDFQPRGIEAGLQTLKQQLAANRE